MNSNAIVHNYSSIELSEQDSLLLAKGLNFAPTPNMITDTSIIKDAIHKLTTTIIDKGYNNPELSQSWIEKISQDIFASTRENDLTIRSNISANQRARLHSLVNDKAIVIKPADKNLGCVLLDRTTYDNEMLRQLNDQSTYSRIFLSNNTQRQNILNGVFEQINQFKHSFSKTDDLWKLSVMPPITPENCAIPQIYGLPKIHKLQKGDDATKIKCRPIIPGFNWLTVNLSRWLGSILQKIVNSIPSISESTDNSIRSIEKTKLPSNIHFITADIESLYTNIPINEAINLVCDYIDSIGGSSDITTDCIFQALSIILNNAYLQFNGIVYKQIKGTAMGTPCAPQFANIYVRAIEEKTINYFRDLKFIYFYHRYLDDLFIVTGDNETLKLQFMQEMNGIHPSIKFEFISNSQSCIFLDLVIFKGKRFQESGILDLRTYQKELNLFMYIAANSFHSSTIKRNFISNELIRYVKTCSNIHDYIEMKYLFLSRLLRRGYQYVWLRPIFNTIKYYDRNKFLLKKHRPRIPYFLFLPNNIITYRSKLYRILQRHWPKSIPVPPLPFITMSKAFTLRNILCSNRVVKDVSESPTNNTVGVPEPEPNHYIRNHALQSVAPVLQPNPYLGNPYYKQNQSTVPTPKLSTV